MKTIEQLIIEKEQELSDLETTIELYKLRSPDKAAFKAEEFVRKVTNKKSELENLRNVLASRDQAAVDAFEKQQKALEEADARRKAEFDEAVAKAYEKGQKDALKTQVNKDPDDKNK